MERDRLSFYEPNTDGAPVSVISVPLELGSDERGLAAAPKYIFEHGLEKMFSAIGREVSQNTTLICPKPSQVVSAGVMKHVEAIVRVGRRAKAVAEKAARRGDTVVALGGDHSAALGPIAGAASAHRSLGLIYIDAHPDCTTDETTISGNVHGMVVSSAIGRGNKALTDLFSKHIAPEHVLYIAIKDIDKGEIDLIRESGMHYVTMLDIAAQGLSPVLRLVGALSQRVEKIWVSVDLDSIDEQYAPAVAMATPGGLTRREIVSIAHHIGRVCDVAGIDIVEMLPAKDREAATARLAIELLARLLGGQYDWYEHYMEHYREINVTGERETVAVRRGQGR